MELKHLHLVGKHLPPLPFNRTIVELKRSSDPGHGTNHHSFNRTIVELKRSNIAVNYRAKGAFNRTIVELKLPIQLIIDLNSLILLIVP